MSTQGNDMKKINGFWIGILIASIAMISLFIYIINVRYPLDQLLDKYQLESENVIYEAHVNQDYLVLVGLPDTTLYLLLDENIFGYKLLEKGSLDSGQQVTDLGFTYKLLNQSDNGSQNLLLGYVNNPNIKEIQYQPSNEGVKVKVNQSYYVIKLGRQISSDYQLIGLDEANQPISRATFKDNQVQIEKLNVEAEPVFEDGTDFELSDGDETVKSEQVDSGIDPSLVEVLSHMDEGVAYTFYGFINAYDLSSRTITVNEISWITHLETVEALNLDKEQLEQSGFVISDLDDTLYELSLADEVRYTMLNESTEMEVDGSAIWEFIDYMEEDDFNYPFTFKILNGKVYEINQVYLP